MKELIKKILTSKAARNVTTLSMLAATLAIAGNPWDLT